MGRTRFRAAWLASAVAFAALTTPLAAHHSFGAEYDANKPITLSGVITRIDWTNPHSYFYLDVTDDKGNVVNWKFEGYPPTALSRTGWKRDVTMKVGDKITVFGWRARDDSNLGHSREITFADGKKLFFGPPAGTGDGGAAPAVKLP
jgi:uncharacterized protein DUF6152